MSITMKWNPQRFVRLVKTNWEEHDDSAIEKRLVAIRGLLAALDKELRPAQAKAAKLNTYRLRGGEAVRQALAELAGRQPGDDA